MLKAEMGNASHSAVAEDRFTLNPKEEVSSLHLKLPFNSQ